MPIITELPDDGGTKLEVSQRYTVEIFTAQGGHPHYTFPHESEGAALARVTAHLVRFPYARMVEERYVSMNHPTRVIYKLFGCA